MSFRLNFAVPDVSAAADKITAAKDLPEEIRAILVREVSALRSPNYPNDFSISVSCEGRLGSITDSAGDTWLQISVRAGPPALRM